MLKYERVEKNSPAHPITESINLAFQAHANGESDQAKRICMEVLQQYPTHPDALHLIGMIALEIISIATLCKPAR